MCRTNEERRAEQRTKRTFIIYISVGTFTLINIHATRFPLYNL